MMKNLIKKEVMVGLRAMGGTVVALLLGQIILTFYINKDIYANIMDRTILNSALLSSIMFFPLMLIPLIAVVLMDAVMGEEKKERILQVLFANGVSAKQIWRSRVIVASGVSYIVNCVGIVISFIYIRIAYNMWIDINIKDFFNMFILLPLIAIAVVNIICLLMWSSKTAQSFVGIIPGISYMACIYLSTLQIKIFRQLNDDIVECIILGIVVFVIAGCEMIAKKLSKEYLIHIHS